MQCLEPSMDLVTHAISRHNFAVSRHLAQTHSFNVSRLLSDCIPDVALKVTAGKRFRIVLVLTSWWNRVTANDGPEFVVSQT